MQKIFNIITQQFRKKAVEQGFYFVVVVLVAYLCYQNVPKMVLWFVNREDHEKQILRQQNRECDSINRVTNAAMLRQLQDCYTNQ